MKPTDGKRGCKTATARVRSMHTEHYAQAGVGSRKRQAHRVQCSVFKTQTHASHQIFGYIHGVLNQVYL